MSARKAPEKTTAVEQRRGGTGGGLKKGALDQATDEQAVYDQTAHGQLASRQAADSQQADLDKSADSLDPHDTIHATYSLEMAEELSIPRTPLDHEPTSWRKRRSE